MMYALHLSCAEPHPCPESMPAKTLILVFFSVLITTDLCIARKDDGVFRDYRLRSSEEIAIAIRNDLASKDPARRDRAVMFLSILINSGNTSQKEHETVLRLAKDRKAVDIASDIVAERLAGWYEERESGQERSMPMYYPLIYLLSVSKSKTAGITLVMALPVAGFDAFFRRSLFSSERGLPAVLSRLSAIENKICCFYPGKDLVCIMQAIDFRLNMLRMYLEAAKDKRAGLLSSDVEMEKFVSGCLEFGDGNKGRIIRTMAVEIAGICIKAGQNNFLPALKKIAESDPCYLYRAGPAESNFLPRYDINSKYYPVREKAGKELSRLGGS
jgi:hypothetical protein